jgi:murein L,D-transpeptidase YcbB/YkuD
MIPPVTVRRALLLMACTLLAAACTKEGNTRSVRVGRRFHHPAVWAPATLTAVQNVPIADLRTAISAQLAGTRPYHVDEEAWKHTRGLYRHFGQTPLWFTTDGLAKDRVKALTDAVLGVTKDGLRVDAYPISDLTNALYAIKQAKAPTATQLATADVLLSAMYTSLGEDLLTGQVSPTSMGQAWHIDATDEEVDSALVHVLGDTLERGIDEMRPPEAEYATLQKELQRYRDIVAKGEWPRVSDGKALKPGQSESPERISALRQRLAIEGYDVGDTATSGMYINSLAEAVGEFQSRHGLSPSKVLTSETIEAMNVPAVYRLGQVTANLERYRWLPRALPNKYVYVNVPAFQLTAYDSGSAALEMKVIVGQEFEDKATPVFADSMEMVVFRPYWLVTPSIQRKEIEPKLASNPGYMNAENMEYYTDGGERRIRQRPGPKNALGYVKFLFPNDYNIYLHDTPNHELFEKDIRAFSHGCIRVEKPADLAQWVLGWDAARVQDAMMNGSDNHTVRLPKKIPVFILYGTAFVRDGQLHFANDLYHRDEKLVQATAGGALPSQSAITALQALAKAQ